MSEHELPDSWLESSGEQARDSQRALAIAFAKNYLVFETHPQAKALLAHWDQTLLKKRTPTNATLADYAANEALRSFVHGIHEQIELANTEGK